MRKYPAAEPPHPRSLRSLDLSPLARGEMEARSRGALCPSLQIDLQNDRTFSLCASFYSLFPIPFSLFVISSLVKEGRQNADRRRTNRRAYGRGARSAERARLSAFHRGSCIGERTPPLSSSRASWDPALTGVTRLPPIPVQRAPRRPVIVPAGRCPKPPGSGVQIRPRAPHPLHLTACLR